MSKSLVRGQILFNIAKRNHAFCIYRSAPTAASQPTQYQFPARPTAILKFVQQLVRMKTVPQFERAQPWTSFTGLQHAFCFILTIFLLCEMDSDRLRFKRIQGRPNHTSWRRLIEWMISHLVVQPLQKTPFRKQKENDGLNRLNCSIRTSFASNFLIMLKTSGCNLLLRRRSAKNSF